MKPISNHIDKQGFIEAERKYQEWVKTEEGQRYMELSRQQQERIANEKRSTSESNS